MSPKGFGTMFPYIFASQASEYLRFLKAAFDAQEIGISEDPDGTIANARIRIGTTTFMVSEATEGFEPSRAAFYLYVEDADEAFKRAVSCGAEKIMDPMDMPYGDRQGGVTDPSGNLWWISTRRVQKPYDS